MKAKEFLNYYDRLETVYSTAAKRLYKDPSITFNIEHYLDSYCNIESDWLCGEPEYNSLLIDFSLFDSDRTDGGIVSIIVDRELSLQEKIKEEKRQRIEEEARKAKEAREYKEWETFIRLKKKYENKKYENIQQEDGQA